MNQMGRLLIEAGLIFIVLGLIIILIGKAGGIPRLPGDIYIRRGNFAFYFPIVTCLVLSLILTVVLSLFRR